MKEVIQNNDRFEQEVSDYPYQDLLGGSGGSNINQRL